MAEALNDAYAARGIEPVKHAVGIFTSLFQYRANRFLNLTDIKNHFFSLEQNFDLVFYDNETFFRNYQNIQKSDRKIFDVVSESDEIVAYNQLIDVSF